MALRRSRYWNAENSAAFGINSRARAENSGAVCRRRGLVACFTRQSAMESSVVSSLPDSAFTPTLASTGWSNQLWNTLAKLVGIAPHVSHIVDRSPSALLPSGSLMECGRALDEPFFGMPTRIRVLQNSPRSILNVIQISETMSIKTLYALNFIRCSGIP